MSALKPSGWIALAAFLTVGSGQSGDAAGPANRPRELGVVAWHRGFDNAAKLARKQDRPLLVLFQEVPGCSTCVGYGERVLSHPLVVEAAETLFVPVAVFNNIKGDDEKTLQSFNEPAWNNPVVRVMTPDRTELAPRVTENYTVAGMVHAMTAALQKLERPVPTYLALLDDEAGARATKIERATFAMHCFWEGEAALGRIPGVVATAPGFLKDLEVVEVEFDPRVVGFAALLEKARRAECASRVFTRSEVQQNRARKMVGSNAQRNDDPLRVDKQPKYHLAQTPLRFLPMTPLQAARINAALDPKLNGPDKPDPRKFLSPRQDRLITVIERHPEADWKHAVGSVDLPKAWSDAVARAKKLSPG